MGIAYISWLYDDSINDAETSPELRAQRRCEIGEALLHLCLQPSIALNPGTHMQERVRHHPVGHLQNGMNFCDAHSTMNGYTCG